PAGPPTKASNNPCAPAVPRSACATSSATNEPVGGATVKSALPRRHVSRTEIVDDLDAARTQHPDLVDGNKTLVRQPVPVPAIIDKGKDQPGKTEAHQRHQKHDERRQYMSAKQRREKPEEESRPGKPFVTIRPRRRDAIYHRHQSSHSTPPSNP